MTFRTQLKTLLFLSLLALGERGLEGAYKFSSNEL